MWWRALALAVIFTACTVQSAFAPGAPPRGVITPADGTSTNLLVVLRPSVSNRLARDWGQFYVRPDAVEHAYCLSRFEELQGPGDEALVFVDSVTPAATDSATPNAVVYDCGLVPAIHTHPPATCEYDPWGTWYCVPIPRNDEEFCAPSTTDIRTAAHNLHRFDLLQCGERRFVVYTGGMG